MPSNINETTVTIDQTSKTTLLSNKLQVSLVGFTNLFLDLIYTPHTKQESQEGLIMLYWFNAILKAQT